MQLAYMKAVLNGKPVEYEWRDFVDKEGYYYGISVEDDKSPEHVFGPVYVHKLLNTGSYVVNTVEQTWLLANSGKWQWSKLEDQ